MSNYSEPYQQNQPPYDPNAAQQYQQYQQYPQYQQQPPQYQQLQRPTFYATQAYGQAQQYAPIQYQAAPASSASSPRRGDVRSYFDGGALQQLGLQIINFFIIFFTLGICTPWAICRKYNWVQKHTVINGRRLRFDGTAMGLLGTWIKWFFLCLITLGIYSIWVKIDLQKWIIKHTSFAE